MTMSALLARKASCGPGCGRMTRSFAVISAVVRQVNRHWRHVQRSATRATVLIRGACLELLRAMSLQQRDHQRVTVPADGANLLTFLEHGLQRASCGPAPCLILEAIHGNFDRLIPRGSEVRVVLVPVVGSLPVDLRFPRCSADISATGEFLQEGRLASGTGFLPRV